MQLSFSGVGSAFNTELNNTSAYCIKDHCLFLIDCGCTVFKTMNEADLLSDLTAMHIFITHTHSDHVGSLGDLIFYAYYLLGVKLHLYFPQENDMKTLLRIIGVKDFHCHVHSAVETTITQGPFKGVKVSFIPTKHIDYMKTYGLLIEDMDEVIYFSGDAADIDQDIIDGLKKERIRRLYQDTSYNETRDNVHMPLSKLISKIPIIHRNKVWCMHFDHPTLRDKVVAEGFNAAAITTLKKDPKA